MDRNQRQMAAPGRILKSFSAQVYTQDLNWNVQPVPNIRSFVPLKVDDLVTGVKNAASVSIHAITESF